MMSLPAEPLSIALLTHSTNPRGGVVHALELAEALTALGHHAVVHAPDPTGGGFFRTTRCGAVLVPATPLGAGGLADLVEARIADYLAFFTRHDAARYDIHHAQDGISGNALASLREAGRIPGYAYTVHHLDRFADPAVEARQRRAIANADQVFCVSPLWRDILARDHGIDARLVGNGVDRRRFSPQAAPDDGAVRARLRLGPGPVFLSVGGVEARKNSAHLLDAFLIARRTRPDAQLVIAGGASLLDHSDEARAFEVLLNRTPDAAGSVIRTGPLPDADMPALFRLADTLVFPSLREGFGLVVLEAMASGTPTVVSAIAPFTEYLHTGDALWVDPRAPAAIAAAMIDSLHPATAQRLRAAGLRRSTEFGWDACAHRHLDAYRALLAQQRSLAHA